MNRSEFTELVKQEFNHILEINQTKGKEYASEADALSNFYRRSEELGISPKAVWAVFAGKHWDSIMHYCKEGKVLSEPIEGRIRDLILYLLLLEGLAREESNGT